MRNPLNGRNGKSQAYNEAGQKVCYKCGKPGHFKRDCKSKKGEKGNTVVEENEIALILEHISKKKTGTGLWVGDSGATCHIGPSLKGCTNVKFVDEETTVGNGKPVQTKARAMFHGHIKVKKTGEMKKIKIENFAYSQTWRGIYTA